MPHTRPPRTNRRTFLASQLAAAAAAPMAVLPATVFGRQGTPPSERVTLGFIGIGAMGSGHLRCFLGFDDVQVLACCDVDRWRREHAKSVVEQTYAGANAAGTYRGCRDYTDLRDVVDRNDIDAVVIATGDRWHAVATVLAAASGKDVYCEKPISLTIGEAWAMVEAVGRHQRVFQAGLQQRSAPEFQAACRLAQEGAIGKLQYVYVGFPGTSEDVNLPPEPVPDGLDWDLWLGPSPWRPYNRRFHPFGPHHGVVPWHFCRDFGGGNLTSNAVHAFDVVQWGLGMDRSGPVEIIPPETGQVPVLTYKYPNGVVLQVQWKLDPNTQPIPPGWDPDTRLQNFGALFVGQNGWIHVGREGYLRSYPADIVDQRANWPEHRVAVTGHQRNWIDCIRSRRRPACDVETACRSTTVSHLGCIAHWTGRRLRWDPQQQRFSDDETANRMRSRPLREPWHV